MTDYLFIYKGGQGEIEEKKSRFIAHIEPIATEQDALDFIARTKKQYWDARHNCFSYVLGSNHELQRCSDDGEPGGTAGRPMLDVLLKENIHNCAAVVTRYFGGTLLGTGGLVRAYQKSLQAGLSNCIILTHSKGTKLHLYTDYTGLGKIQYLLAKEGIPTLDSNYTHQVEMTILIPSHQLEHIKTQIIECTNGSAVLELSDTVSFAVYEGNILILDEISS